MSTCFASTIILSVAVAAAAEIPAKQVRLQNGPETAVCKVRRGRATLESRSFGYVWTCEEGGGVSCDGERAEPSDWAFPNCPRDAAIGARTREITIPDLPQEGWEAANIEWRSLSASGTELRASRPLRANPLKVSRQARVLRLIREGNSPQSIPLSAGTLPKNVRFEEGRRGGELFGRFETSGTLRPATVTVEQGGRSWGGKVDAEGFFSLVGLPRGDYVLRGEYAGGIALKTDYRAATEDGRTTEVFNWSVPPVGALNVSMRHELCRDDSFLDITMKGRARAYRGEAAACGSMVGGLDPGVYEVSLRRKDEPSVTRMSLADVRPGEVTQVALGEDQHRVSGSIRLNGERLPGRQRLQFRLAKNRVDIVTFAEDGDYAVNLPVPGQYQLSVMAGQGLPSRWYSINVADEPLVHDIDLIGAALRIRIEGDQSFTSAQIHLDGRKPFSGWAGAKDLPEVLLLGLDPGSYLVSADTIGMASEAKNVELVGKETSTVELHMVSSLNANLVLNSAAGLPVEEARVQANHVTILPKVAPGVYSLDRVASGAPLSIVAPGHLPYCATRTGSPSSDLVLTLTPVGSLSASIRLKGAPAGVRSPIGEIAGVTVGSCFSNTLGARVTRDGKDAIITFEGLAEGDYRFRPSPGAAWKPLRVPGPEIEFTFKSTAPPK